MQFNSLVYCVFLIVSASAHIGSEPKDHKAGGGSEVAFTVGHACSPTVSTTSVEFEMPIGIISVRAKQMPGWNITVTKKALSPAPTVYGKPVTESVDKIIFTAVEPMNDDVYQKFNLKFHAQAYVEVESLLSDAEKKGTDGFRTVFFKVVQKCSGAEVSNWVSLNSADEKPAPTIRLSDTYEAVQSAASVEEPKMSQLALAGVIIGSTGAILALIAIAVSARLMSHIKQ